MECFSKLFIYCRVNRRLEKIGKQNGEIIVIVNWRKSGAEGLNQEVK